MLYLQLQKLLPKTVVGLQQKLHVEKNDSREIAGCLNWTISIGRRKVCVNFKTDTGKSNIAVCQYRNHLYQKDNKTVLKLTQDQSPSTKRVYVLSYNDIFFKHCNVLDETTVPN